MTFVLPTRDQKLPLVGMHLALALMALDGWMGASPSKPDGQLLHGADQYMFFVNSAIHTSQGD